jgi:hypothetical protein
VVEYYAGGRRSPMEELEADGKVKDVFGSGIWRNGTGRFRPAGQRQKQTNPQSPDRHTPPDPPPNELPSLTSWAANR